LVDDSGMWNPLAWEAIHEIVRGSTPQRWENIQKNNNLSKYEYDRTLFKLGHYKIPKIYEIKQGDYIVDVGAYDDISSVFFAEECGLVFVFESSKYCYQKLVKMKESLNIKQIIPVQKVLFDSTAKIRMTGFGVGSTVGDIGDECGSISFDDYVKHNLIDRIL